PGTPCRGRLVRVPRWCCAAATCPTAATSRMRWANTWPGSATRAAGSWSCARTSTEEHAMDARTRTTTRPAIRFFQAVLLASSLVACQRDASTATPALTVQDWKLPAPPGAAQPDLALASDGRLLLAWVEPAGAGDRPRLGASPGHGGRGEAPIRAE